MSDRGPSRQAGSPPRYSPPSTASALDNGRRRSGHPTRDGADGAVQRDDVPTLSRIIHRSCGFKVSRPRCWSRPDSARAIVGAVTRRFHLQRHPVRPTPSGGHGSCKHPLLCTKGACYRHRHIITQTRSSRGSVAPPSRRTERARDLLRLQAGSKQKPYLPDLPSQSIYSVGLGFAFPPKDKQWVELQD